MYLLDTNIISMLDTRRHAHAPHLVKWIDRNLKKLSISVITLTEMERGILKLRRKGDPKRADDFALLLQGVLADFGDRVLAVDVETALQVARIGELVHQRQVDLPDIIIAATAARHSLTILTRNLSDFGTLNVPAIDPFAQLPPDVP